MEGRPLWPRYSSLSQKPIGQKFGLFLLFGQKFIMLAVVEGRPLWPRYSSLGQRPIGKTAADGRRRPTTWPATTPAARHHHDWGQPHCCLGMGRVLENPLILHRNFSKWACEGGGVVTSTLRGVSDKCATPAACIC